MKEERFVCAAAFAWASDAFKENDGLTVFPNSVAWQDFVFNHTNGNLEAALRAGGVPEEHLTQSILDVLDAVS